VIVKREIKNKEVMVKEKKNNKGERHIKEKNERIREKNRR
jgi:hypothetical protein